MIKFLKLKNRVGNSKKFSLMLRVTVLILLMNFIFFYVAQISRSSVSVYEINSLKNKIADLHDNNKLLKKEAAESQSTASVKKRLSDLGFVQVENVKYIESGKVMARVES
ncbi:hypothetical protein KAI52_03110 [Candidatus Parcubacteria bacterium]|nr:hypothetical protein [Candidatus Parcubacteria bacterium]